MKSKYHATRIPCNIHSAPHSVERPIYLTKAVASATLFWLLTQNRYTWLRINIAVGDKPLTVWRFVGNTITAVPPGYESQPPKVEPRTTENYLRNPGGWDSYPGGTAVIVLPTNRHIGHVVAPEQLFPNNNRRHAEHSQCNRLIRIRT